jgi:hypothetical protein
VAVRGLDLALDPPQGEVSHGSEVVTGRAHRL